MVFGKNIDTTEITTKFILKITLEIGKNINTTKKDDIIYLEKRDN